VVLLPTYRRAWISELAPRVVTFAARAPVTRSPLSLVTVEVLLLVVCDYENSTYPNRF